MPLFADSLASAASSAVRSVGSSPPFRRFTNVGFVPFLPTKTEGVPVTLSACTWEVTCEASALTLEELRSESSCGTFSPGTLSAALTTIASLNQPVFSVPWLS